uniref:Ig-like domain-containing protein n=1 Tax=Ditylenchus dipsaci TaxID=166011 RepID=A0A915ER11_9BILA
MSTSQKLPRFTQLPCSVQCVLGQKVQLYTEFDGQPQPTCSWFFGAQRLTNGAQICIEHPSDSSSHLTILEVTSQHLGEYLCTVRNIYGEDLALPTYCWKVPHLHQLMLQP